MKRVLSLTALLFVLLNGMAQLKDFTVEVPNPPKVVLPESIQSFTIMNRSLTPQFRDYIEKEQQIDFYKQNFTANVVLLDSAASDSTIQFLGDYLFNSQRYDIVIPLERNISRYGNYTKTPPPLSWDQVRAYCDIYATDALMVLENMAVRAVLNYEKGYQDYGFYSEKYYYASMDYYCRAHWRIYDPNEEKILVDYVMNQDTIYWDHVDYNISDLFRNLPTVKQATIETGRKLANDFAEMIAPSWIPATRYYYLLKNKEIDKSVQLAAEGQWQEALNNWLQYENYGNRSNQSKVLLNIALAYEMTGNIDKAIEYTKASIKTRYREVSNHYLKMLLGRKVVTNNL